MCEMVVAWETEWRAVDINIVEAIVSYCARFIVVSCVLPLILHFFLSTLVGALASVKS